MAGEESSESQMQNVMEKFSNFKVSGEASGIIQNIEDAITPQLIMKFLKAIEKGESWLVIQMLIKHPKLLTDERNHPSVLQEEDSANILHLASKYNKPIIAYILISIIQNSKFLEKLYPDENLASIKKRQRELINLYLNTPDEPLGETPLHYAAKFGSIDCVTLLTSNPFCCINIENKDAKTAQYCSKSEEISEAFEKLHYVTILRSGDISSPPVIAKPTLKRNILISFNKEELKDEFFDDYKYHSHLIIKAFGGPMTVQKANEFYQLLKNPSKFFLEKEDVKVLQEIKNSDPVKGYERIARLLAEDLSIPYMEYFSFVNLFTNFSRNEGLYILENVLKTRKINQNTKQLFRNQQSCNIEDSFDWALIKPEAHVNPLGHDLNVFLKKGETDPYEMEDEEYITAPSSPQSDDEYVIAQEYPSIDEDFFINGFSLTRLDVDVSLAIGNRNIDRRIFPVTHSWKNRVEKKLCEYEKNEEIMKTLTPLAKVAVPRLNQMSPKPNAISSVKRKLF